MHTRARPHLQIAEALLARPSSNDLLVAALHLRMCIELITYEKLRHYENRVPKEVIEKWQPPQAVRALLAFEPEADQSFTFEVGDRDVPDLIDTSEVKWLLLGKHNALSKAWLGKHYHKVGRLLHATYSDLTPDIPDSDTQSYLVSVANDLREVLSGTILGSPSSVFTFKCPQCGALVARNADAMRAGKRAICLNQECETEFVAKNISDEGAEVVAVLESPPCCSCNTPMHLHPRKVKAGSEIKCPQCGQLHIIAGHNWLYGPK